MSRGLGGDGAGAVEKGQQFGQIVRKAVGRVGP
ncbi:hypothetical protein SAMN05444374_107101 [Rhodococcoides kroppenstedtii]|uniref:Uncharacterized protein n=1 Tax=Rhodococcoides kroppenstedtii TaxID=293050 RepID=A0A1I0TK49_9NOCA|nr:hypothetical protein SAMN05444374_107101 [Rhodococcus kroppenstedtii]